MNTNNLEIFSDYPGGNIKIIDYKDNTVFVEQDLSGTNKWWFYWNFHAKSKNNREITFKFTNGEVVGPWGPAVSDDGLNWKWLGSSSIINRSSFKYRFEDNEEKYFSFAFPYTMKNFNIFYNIYKNSKNIKYKELTISEQNRVVPLIVTGKKKTKKDIIFTCRHHACESSASYILEGLMEYIFNNKESKLVNDYLIHIIPFVDIDGVENGEQGKNRFPHDHNRDYINRPIYRSTAAIMDYVDKLDVAFGIDFHSPHKWGGG